MVSLVTREFEVRKHVMLDLETLGTGSDAVVVQAGACKFDLIDPSKKLRVMKWNLAWVDQVELTRTIDRDTMSWWMQQSEKVRKSVFGAGTVESTEKVLSTISSFIGDAVVWANPADFDIAIMTSLFRSFDMKVPWFHRDTVCLRSICTAAGYNQQSGPKPEIPHDAGSDVVAQARQAQEAWAKLRRRKN